MSSETFVFLPWLRLKESIEIYDLVFSPIGEDVGFSTLPEYAKEQAKLISSSYTDRAGHAVPDFTVVLKNNRNKPHDLTDEDYDLAREAASILFFCSWSLNDYYCQLGNYSNSSLFSVVGKRLSPNDPQGIALSSRRRDGEILCGGYKHGQVRFVSPSQYAINRQVSIDTTLLNSLLTSREQGDKLFDLLVSVMGLIELANTDNDYMNLSSEIILMGSVLETFLEIEGNQKALKVGQAFYQVFSQFGSKTAKEAIDNGRGIHLSSKGTAENWPILQAWAHEFYQLRNEHVHSKKTPNRTWGWHDLEHLIFVAFSFPLVVKAKLAQNDFYALTDRDKQNCYALGELLCATGWNEPPHEFNNRWKKIISDASWKCTREILRAQLNEE